MTELLKYKAQMAPQATQRRVETAPYREASATFGSLAQRLEQFSSFALNQYGKQAQNEAVESAKQDSFNYMRETQRINTDTKLTEMEKVQQLDELKNNVVQSNMTVYGRAYNTAFDGAYTNQITLEAQNAANLAEVHADGDPEAFMRTYGSYQRKLIAEAPNENLAIAANNTFSSYGISTYKKLAIAKSKKILEQNEQLFKDDSALTESLYFNAVKDGNVVAQGQLIAKYSASFDLAIKQGFATEADREYNLNRVARETYKVMAREEFSTADNKIKILDKVRDNKFLTVEETDKFVDELNGQIEADIKSRKLLDESEELEYKNIIKEGKYSLDYKLWSGKLSESDVLKARESGIIDSKETKYYMDERTKIFTQDEKEKSEEETLSIYTDLHLLNIEDIKRNANLTNADKKSLIDRKLRADDWLNSKDGKQAVREIKGAFGFYEGTLMSQLDFENLTAKDYNLIQKMFYDQVEDNVKNNKLPNALQIGRDLIGKYFNGEFYGTKPYEDKEKPEIEVEETVKSKEVDNPGIVEFIKNGAF